MTPAAPSRSRRIRQSATMFVVSAAVMWVVVAVVPGLSASRAADVLVTTVVLAVVSAVLRPGLAFVATRMRWVGVVLVSLVAQALIFYAALTVSPGITLTGFWPAFWASWVFALLVECVGWMFDANDDEIFIRDIVRHAQPTDSTQIDQRPGVVILQIDGLAAPLLEWVVRNGDLPTLSRWIRSGGHRMTPWRAMLPATTPASQAGILHGGSDAVPAFRWYEKENARLTVTSRPKDAAYVEKTMSNGRGLLAGGGASIGNIFSGDAPIALLTMSVAGHATGPSRSFTASYLRPFGFTRSLLLTLGEMVKEIYQGYRQRSRAIEPRIDRLSSYVALRGVTNVLLRDLNVRLLAEQMLAGTPVMYCDFTDYDEVAHHAGPTRPESLASLAGVDRAIAALERVAAVSPRPYEFVVLSDHGQSQGATFLQRYGEPFEAVVRRLLTSTAEVGGVGADTVAKTDEDDEEWGPIMSLLRTVGAGSGALARMTRRFTHAREDDPVTPAEAVADVVVTGSGNLAFVYLPRSPGRLSLEELERTQPGLVDGLVAHDGVGFVVVRSERHGTVVIGREGRHLVDEERVEGVDPLLPFGPEAAGEIRRHANLEHVGDLVVNSRIDDGTHDVAAFEELVGCHGGLGGWQSEAALVYPSSWSTPPELVGADAVHHQLVRWLVEQGQRADLGTPSM